MKTENMWRRALSGTFSVLLVIVAIRLFSSAPPPALQQQLLEVAPETLSIGRVEFARQYAHTLRIRNVTDSDILVSEFLTSCTCVNILPSSLTIPARAEASIELTLDMVKYVTPGRELVIRGEVEVAPVVSTQALEKWIVRFDLVRPKLLSMSSEIDFGIVYDDRSNAASDDVLFVTDDLALEDLALTTEAPFVRQISIVPLEDHITSYKRFRLDAQLVASETPPGHHAFDLVLKHPAGPTLQIPCHVRLDSGLRLHVPQPPPKIVSLDREVVWNVDLYQVDGKLTNVLAKTGDHTEEAIRTIEQQPLGDGTWRLTCGVTPRQVGNIGFHLRVSAELANGETDSGDYAFLFYVPNPRGGR